MESVEQKAPEQKKEEKKKQPKQKKEGTKEPAKKKINVDALELPEYIDHRLKLWEELKKKDEEERQSLPQTPIKVTLPGADGKELPGVANKTTPYDIAMSISKGLAEASVVAKVNGELWDLLRPLEGDCKLELLKFDAPEAQHVFWHSSAHILGEALERLYKVHLCVGPPLEEGGFFYDSRMENHTVSQDDFEVIEEVVQKIISEKQPFERLFVKKEDALEMFKYNPYKSQILRQKVADGTKCCVYRCGTLIDPCRGPHLPNTYRVKGFKVTKNSSSYWEGKATNDALQRVYAISFPDKKLLQEWVKKQELAAQRDHRRIGLNQELFFFSDMTPGCAFFLPHGARIYNKMMEFLRNEYKNRGFTEVVSPNIFSNKLWNISGHFPKYKENMFTFEVEKQEFALKPMNCPGHCLMFGYRQRSYKELPLRFADFGVLHRNELSGALTGLTRVRRFQQDDAHIFCAPDQIQTEIKNALAFMEHVYGVFGFEFDLELSTRPENFMGDINIWNNAEKQLEDVLNEYKARTGKVWKLNPGDGAFYGPKIDIHISDALGRSHQCATIQLDFQLPINFNLEYAIPDQTTMGRPVMIHRAIYGSFERFLAILIEHTGGKWPFWISPRQVMVVPVSEKVDAYVEEVRKAIHDAGFYVDTDLSGKTMQKKIREAQMAQYNYILVVGEKEFADKTVNVRTRDNVVHGTKPLQEVIAEFQQLAKEFK